MTSFAPRQHTARNVYTCEHCRHSIQPGDRYKAQTYVELGRAHTERVHIDCDAAAQAYWSMTGAAWDEREYLRNEEGLHCEAEDRAWLEAHHPEVAARVFNPPPRKGKAR